MKMTKDELQRYADELPIGYYAHTRLRVTIDENADTSYFMPTTREIFISLINSQPACRAGICLVKRHSVPHAETEFQIEMRGQHMGITRVQTDSETVTFFCFIRNYTSIVVFLVSELSGKPPS